MAAGLPKWVAGLAAAHGADWIPAIVNTDENAVIGLLHRHGLPDPGTQIARGEAINAALTAGTITDADLAAWRDEVFAVFEAIESIEDFRQKEPLIQRFRADVGVPGGASPLVLDELRKRMWRGDLMPQRWVEFLDSRRNETDRELFLFRLPAELRKWRDAQVLEKDMRAVGFAHLIGELHYEWKPASWVLVGVNPTPPHHLELRWVGLRRAKRSLTFARIDLENGEVELQIQRVKIGGMKALKEERDLFVGELTRLLGVRPEPVHLDPAMRALMNAAHVQLEMWRVRVGQAGELKGKHVEMLRPRNKRYYALELQGKWNAGDGGVPVRMDSRTDAIGLHWQGPGAEVAGLIRFVREHAQPRRPPPPPRPPRPPGGDEQPDEDARLEELRATIERLIAYLGRVAPDVDVSSLASENVSDDLGTDPQEVEDALETVGLEGTDAKFYFTCPDTNTPVKRGGRVVELEQLPPTVLCENLETPKVHPTRGITHIKVRERHRLTPVHYIWLAFGPYFVLMTWAFAAMDERFPNAPVQLFIGNALSAIAPVAAIFSIYGREAFEAATDLVSWIYKPLLKIKKGGGKPDEADEADEAPEEEE